MKKLCLLAFLLLLGGWTSAQAQQSPVSADLKAASADCSTTNSCLEIAVAPPLSAASVTFSINNGAASTFQFEVWTGDAHAAWVAVNATPANSTTAVTSTTGSGSWTAAVAGYQAFRVRCSAYTSGDNYVTIRNSNAIASNSLGGGGGGGVAANAIQQGVSCTNPGTTVTAAPGNGYFSPCNYGAVGDAFTSLGCTTTLSSPIVNCPNAAFPANIVGDVAFITTANVNGSINGSQTTIAVVNSATQVTLTSGAGITALAGTAVLNYGHDDTTALNNTLVACQAALLSHISGCNVVIPCQGFLVQGAVLFPIFTLANSQFGEDVNGCTSSYGTTSVILQAPNFNWATCTSGCFFNAQEAYFGQSQVNNVTISNGGNAGMSGPGSNTYLISVIGQSIMSNITIAQWNNTNVSGISCANICDIRQVQCYSAGAYCISIGNGARATISGGMSFLGAQYGGLIVGSGAIVTTKDYVQIPGGSVGVDNKGTYYDYNGYLTGQIAINMESNSAAYFYGSTLVAISTTLPAIAQNVPTSASVVRAKNTTITQSLAGPLINLGTSGTGLFFDDGGNTFTPYTGQPIFRAAYYSPGEFIADGHSVYGACTGVGTASSTLGLYGTGANVVATTCTSALIGTGVLMTRAGTIPFLLATATVAGTNASSGVVTVVKNGSGSALTCTIGTGTFCQNNTPLVFAAGDRISIEFTTQLSDTLAGVQVMVPYN